MATLKNKLEQKMLDKGLARGWHLAINSDTREVTQVAPTALSIADMNPIDLCICKTIWWGWGIKDDIVECAQAAWEGVIAILALAVSILLLVVAPISFPIMAWFKIRHERKWCDRVDPNWRNTLKKQAAKK